MEKVSFNLRVLSAVSVAHFFVDFACIFLVTSLLPAAHWLIYALLYNFCAFALQLPMGIWADLRRKQLPFTVLGCALVLSAFLFVFFSPLAGCIIAGIGNGFFHVGGGVAVMRGFPKKAAPLGVFVSPGALGVFCGVTLAGIGNAVLWGLLPVLTAVMLVLSFVGRTEEGVSYHPGVSLKKTTLVSVFALLMLFFAVALRSYLGLLFSFPWKTGFLLSFLVVAGVAVGKALGGFFSDRFGLILTALVSLTLCAVLLIFADYSPVCGVLALCCFNMTMPLTLFALGELLGDAKGLAFGLTTFALFLGTLPSLLPSLTAAVEPAFEILLVALSAFFIVSGAAIGGGGSKQ